MKICQSCGMPLTEELAGTNLDGSKNPDFCCYCYLGGVFTDDGITMEEKIKKNIEIAIRGGMSRKEATTLARKTIPRLKRWN